MNTLQHNHIRELELKLLDGQTDVLRYCGWKLVQERPTSPLYWRKKVGDVCWTAPDIDSALKLEMMNLDLGSIG